jgi:preprotein translocase subunit YajC
MAGMHHFVVLLAQQAASGPSGSNFWVGMIPFLPIIIFFYLFLIRPQQKQERQRRQMLEAIKKNDKVMTAGGIIGAVVSIDTTGNKVVLRVDDQKDVRMTFDKRYVVSVVNGEKPADAGKPAPVDEVR